VAVLQSVTEVSSDDVRRPDVALRCRAGDAHDSPGGLYLALSATASVSPCGQAFNRPFDQSSRLIIATAASGGVPMILMCGRSGPVILFAQSESGNHG
jgi:hypothetical protein